MREKNKLKARERRAAISREREILREEQKRIGGAFEKEQKRIGAAVSKEQERIKERTVQGLGGNG